MDLIAQLFYFKKKKRYLIKRENIFEQFYGDVYTIEYQKLGLPHIHLLIFLYLDNQFFKVFHNDEVIYAKIPTLETNLSGEFIRIVTSVMLYGLCGDINFHFLYISNARYYPSKCTKRYPHEFFEKTTIQENGYLLYW